MLKRRSVSFVVLSLFLVVLYRVRTGLSKWHQARAKQSLEKSKRALETLTVELRKSLDGEAAAKLLLRRENLRVRLPNKTSQNFRSIQRCSDALAV
jgi:hypothetical protein